MLKWEYLCLEAPHSTAKDDRVAGEKVRHVQKIETIMNALGAEGWELVAVRDELLSENQHNFGTVLFFKRPREFAAGFPQ